MAEALRTKGDPAALGEQTPPQPRLVVGNWKMHGRRAEAGELVRAIASWHRSRPESPDLVLCPPFPLLETVGRALEGTNIALGAQDCRAEPDGRFTGDVNAPMLVDAGCSFVILGHSERRQGHDETSPMIARKVAAAMECGLDPIICVGENAGERAAGRADAVVLEQLRGSLPELGSHVRITIAYEPVWAIGSGRTPSSAEISEMHRLLRHAMAQKTPQSRQTRILYGGSVNPSNASAIALVDGVDGVLIGSASLNAEAMTAIAHAFAGPIGNSAQESIGRTSP